MEVFNALLVGSLMGLLQAGVWLAPLSVGWALVYHTKFAIGGLTVYAFSYFDGSQVSTKRNRAWPAFSSGFWLLRFMRSYFPQRVHLPKGFPAAADPLPAAGTESRATTAETSQSPAGFGLQANTDISASSSPAAAPKAESAQNLQYILALHPHGTMSEFRIMLDAQLMELLPALKGRIRWLAASVLFRLPLIREFCLWTGCIDASRKVAEAFLKAGFTIGVVPGGEQEQLRTEYGKEAVFLKSRKGFVKLAIRFGVPLVPCYVFGCVDLYRTSRLFFGLRKALVSNFGVCLPLCWGPKGMPLAPFRTPLEIVVGDPLDVGSNPSPTDEEVQEALTKYIAALVALFDANKAKFGYGDRTLEVI